MILPDAVVISFFFYFFRFFGENVFIVWFDVGNVEFGFVIGSGYKLYRQTINLHTWQCSIDVGGMLVWRRYRLVVVFPGAREIRKDTGGVYIIQWMQ